MNNKTILLTLMLLAMPLTGVYATENGVAATNESAVFAQDVVESASLEAAALTQASGFYQLQQPQYLMKFAKIHLPYLEAYLVSSYFEFGNLYCLGLVATFVILHNIRWIYQR